MSPRASVRGDGALAWQPVARAGCLGAAWFLRGAAWSLRSWPFEEADQVANGVVAVLGVAQRKLVVNFVAVATSVAGLGEIAGSLELADDLRRGSLRDADGDGNVTEAHDGIRRDAFQHVRVVRHEPPRVISISRAGLHEYTYYSLIASIGDHVFEGSGAGRATAGR